VTPDLAALELPGDPLGLGPGPHPVAFVDWAALDADDKDQLMVDYFGDALLEVVPGALSPGLAGRRAVWLSADLIPLALIGGPGMRELGDDWRDAVDVAAVLLLDTRVDPPAIVGWTGGPCAPPVPVAASLDELV
jgi:hypothetical protein